MEGSTVASIRVERPAYDRDGFDKEYPCENMKRKSKYEKHYSILVEVGNDKSVSCLMFLVAVS